MLLDRLLGSLPDNTDLSYKVIDLVDRLGTFMVFVLMRNLDLSQDRLKKQLASDQYEWIAQVLNPEYLMDWFKGEFVKDNETVNSVLDEFSDVLRYDQRLHEYYDRLMNAELDFGKEVLRPIIRKQYEEIRKRVANN